jgi:hypothetical protein
VIVGPSVIGAGASITHVGGRLVASVVGRDARIFRDFSLPKSLRLRVGDGTEVALCKVRSDGSADRDLLAVDDGHMATSAPGDGQRVAICAQRTPLLLAQAFRARGRRSHSRRCRVVRPARPARVDGRVLGPERVASWCRETGVGAPGSRRPCGRCHGSSRSEDERFAAGGPQHVARTLVNRSCTRGGRPRQQYVDAYQRREALNRGVADAIHLSVAGGSPGSASSLATWLSQVASARRRSDETPEHQDRGDGSDRRHEAANAKSRKRCLDHG